MVVDPSAPAGTAAGTGTGCGGTFQTSAPEDGQRGFPRRRSYRVAILLDSGFDRGEILLWHRGVGQFSIGGDDFLDRTRCRYLPLIQQYTAGAPLLDQFHRMRGENQNARVSNKLLD